MTSVLCLFKQQCTRLESVCAIDWSWFPGSCPPRQLREGQDLAVCVWGGGGSCVGVTCSELGQTVCVCVWGGGVV